MNGIKEKLEMIESLKDSIGDHIWEVFRKYKTINKILFSDPENWEFEGDSITFTGLDGSRGCYDSFSLNIPLEFFTKTEAAFERLAQKIQQEVEQKEINRKAAIKARELYKLAELKAKYEDLV